MEEQYIGRGEWRGEELVFAHLFASAGAESDLEDFKSFHGSDEAQRLTQDLGLYIAAVCGDHQEGWIEFSIEVGSVEDLRVAVAEVTGSFANIGFLDFGFYVPKAAG